MKVRSLVLLVAVFVSGWIMGSIDGWKVGKRDGVNAAILGIEHLSK